jgi:hypothetical protein
MVDTCEPVIQESMSIWIINGEYYMGEDSLPLSIFVALNSGVSRRIPYCSRAELITSERIQQLQKNVPRP